MSDIAIRAENLGKLYRIGPRLRYRTLRDTLTDALVSPFHRLWANLQSEIRNPKLANPQFDIRNSKSDHIWALKDVSFEVKRGEVVGVIGRNGAGKSTLLKILSRITEPTEGYAEIHGRVASLLEVGTGFHGELTGRENIYLNGAILGMKKVEINQKFDEIVAFAEVEKFIDTPVKHYSSGMHLRLAFAVAAHLEPEILLVDEVLAVGDAAFQRKCLGKMEAVAKEGRTVLFVSHNMGAVQRLCNRAVLLENGRAVLNGPTQQVVAGYLQSGMRQVGERIWSDLARAPGNDVVRLCAVRVRNAHGQVTSEFKVTEPFCVEVEFCVLVPGFQLDAGLYFYNESGTLVFLAGDSQDQTWWNRPRPPGIHRSVCHVPGNLLNEGTISVLAGISTNPHTLHAVERDAITLRILDDLRPGGARGNYTREWPGGVLRPLMQWTFGFEPLDNKDAGPRDIRANAASL